MKKKNVVYNKVLFTEEQEKQIVNMYTEQKISTVKIGIFLIAVTK